MTDLNPYIQKLLEGNPLREPLLRSAIQTLRLPLNSHGLDVGCGIGLQTLLLAVAIGPGGRVTGVDINPENLSYGREMVLRAGKVLQISLELGDMYDLPFADHTFDWLWSADCVGYPAVDLATQLKELVRVVKPGGEVIIIAWSSQQLLPGYSLLESRLNATCSGYLPYYKQFRPEYHFLQALRWFREMGLEDAYARTFVGDVQAPLQMEEQRAITSLFEMLWGERTPEVSPDDWSEYLRLCTAGSPGFILDQPDYYAFFTCTLFRGKTPNH